MKNLIKQSVAVLILFACLLSILIVATDNMPAHATPEETCSCAGKGPDCQIAIFQVDHDRKAYCALWTRKTGCCMVDQKRND